MGITPDALDYLNKHIDNIGGYTGLKMLELGCQQMMLHDDKPEGSAAKVWFNSRGVNHTSIDRNGKFNSLPLDLSKPIDRPEWVNHFDIVTDFGTSEHVSNLYQCRKNGHTFCRMQGLILHSNPKVGNWPNHGIHKFSVGFYKALAETGLYSVIDINENYACGNDIDGWQVNAVLKKVRDGFIAEDEFNALYGVHCK